MQPNCTFVHLVIKHCLRAIKCSLTSPEFPRDPSRNIRLITVRSRVKRCGRGCKWKEERYRDGSSHSHWVWAWISWGTVWWMHTDVLEQDKSRMPRYFWHLLLKNGNASNVCLFVYFLSFFKGHINYFFLLLIIFSSCIYFLLFFFKSVAQQDRLQLHSLTICSNPPLYCGSYTTVPVYCSP